METSPWRESYQMKFIFYLDDLSTTTDSPGNAGTASPCLKTYTVAVRLSNTEEKPLTKHNLQVLSTSIPELHQRITGSPRPFTFHKAYLQWDALPREAPRPQTSTPPKTPTPTRCTIPPKSSTPMQCIIPPKALRRSLRKPDVPTTRATPNQDAQPSSSARGNEASAPDWLRCDGSFVPGLGNKEWTTVSFQGEEFVRCVSPVAYTDSARDIAGRCNVADYTEYGQLVFSADVDFLRSSDAGGEEPSGSAAATSDSRDERMKQPRTPSDGRKIPRSKKRHSGTTRRSSGANHGTPSRSPIRM